MKKLLFTGTSDYKKLIEGGYYYVDKTLLIKELLTIGGEVTLICRPRRFGKTLNLSMLRYFFEKPLQRSGDQTETDTSHLFTNTAIWQEPQYRVLQGQSPVIFITFRAVKEDTWESAYKKLCQIIVAEIERLSVIYIKHMRQSEKLLYQKFISGTADQVEFEQSLEWLTTVLQRATGKNVFVFLDEYDAPIHQAYTEGYYDKMVKFMRGFFTAGLKDNTNLDRAMLTGILRTAKEGIFSGLNNPSVCTLPSDYFTDKFGFVAQEVDALIKNQEITISLGAIKEWYNGYRTGEDTLVYNPWSIIECAKNKGRLLTYWVNTSDNKLIKRIITNSSLQVKKELGDLLSDVPVNKEIGDAFVFPGVEQNQMALWSLLMFSGYITYSHREITESGKYSCSLAIPNNEIKSLYKDLLIAIFNESLKTVTHDYMVNALIDGKTEMFSKMLSDFVMNSMSFYEFAEDEPEKSYHIFFMGLLAFLESTYAIRSNRESGTGRFDIMLIPSDKTKFGIILEFKKSDSNQKAAFDRAINDAFTQVKESHYVSELHAQSVTKIITYAIAFRGKELVIKYTISPDGSALVSA